MTWEKQESTGDFWSPTKEGEELEGIVIRKFTGQFGTQYEVETANKESFATPSHKVLQAKMSKVEVGDKVKLVFVKQDLPKLKGQQGAKLYDVYIDQVQEESVK